MAKKDKKSKEAKKARAAEKQKKASTKAESKSKKIAKKLGEDDDDDQDIDAILEQYAKEQEEFTEVKIEICNRPSRRLNPSMVANPLHGKRELILFGGEHNDGSVSHFYNELYTYSTDNHTWRKIISKNTPLPRSSHAMCAHPSGVILMFGGEFSSPKQSTFYHYGDTWILDAESKEWAKIDQKKGPSARSGHRLAIWKNFIIMHGGFRDLGTSSTYLNDVWLFDVSDYKWTQVEFPPNHPIPDARSGHSLLSCADGAVVYGGYCKVKAKKGLQKGKVLTDSWLLKMKQDPSGIRFERRRKQGFVPSPRVGCSLVYHKNRGILFGGVYDFEESEEQLDSEFYNSLYSYHIENNRWYNLSLKNPRKKKTEQVKEKTRDEDLEDILNSILAKANLKDEDDDEDDDEQIDLNQLSLEDDEADDRVEYPVMNQLPHPRFNATTCVVDDTLYIYGGIFERGETEFNLDSMYAIDLGKLDGVKVLREDLSELDKAEANSDEEEEDEDEYEDEDEEEETADTKLEVEEEEEEEQEEEEEEAEMEEEEFPDPRSWLPHPKPFENLRAFYVRTGAQFLEWAISSNKYARGKYLKKAAFDLCEERFWERREAVSVAEDNLEELGGVGEVIERDFSKTTKRR
ncbi:KEL3 [[Candida] subhashii]|uniref:KEL3 n=1 Tax=[Candida] subhashii TaxID=561895 RepID=A0A8J5QI91_9ASCO|nr:KEL3 [[Candida] subhashii]KAG7661800.1 KEL3 [[Candida] subhashii]